MVIKSASITAKTGCDGLKSDNDSLLDFGFVHIIDGVFDLNSKADGIQAATDLLIEKGTFKITTGGGSASTQNAVFITFGSSQSAGQIVRIESAVGETIVALQPSKTYQTLGFSSPKLEKGGTFRVILGGTATDSATDILTTAGLFQAVRSSKILRFRVW